MLTCKSQCQLLRISLHVVPCITVYVTNTHTNVSFRSLRGETPEWASVLRTRIRQRLFDSCEVGVPVKALLSEHSISRIGSGIGIG